MADYNKLHEICDDFSDNIEGWCEVDDGDMIDKSLAEMKAALLEVESTEKSNNTTKDKIIADIKEFLINKAVSKKAFGLETWITDRFSEYDSRQ